jgi:hypothetical protein
MQEIKNKYFVYLKASLKFEAMPKTWIRPMDSWTMDRSKNGSWIGKNPENKGT